MSGDCYVVICLVVSGNVDVGDLLRRAIGVYLIIIVVGLSIEVLDNTVQLKHLC